MYCWLSTLAVLWFMQCEVRSRWTPASTRPKKRRGSFSGRLHQRIKSISGLKTTSDTHSNHAFYTMSKGGYLQEERSLPSNNVQEHPRSCYLTRTRLESSSTTNNLPKRAAGLSKYRGGGRAPRAWATAGKLIKLATLVTLDISSILTRTTGRGSCHWTICGRARPGTVSRRRARRTWRGIGSSAAARC